MIYRSHYSVDAAQFFLVGLWIKLNGVRRTFQPFDAYEILDYGSFVKLLCVPSYFMFDVNLFVYLVVLAAILSALFCPSHILHYILTFSWWNIFSISSSSGILKCKLLLCYVVFIILWKLYLEMLLSTYWN